MFECVRCTRKVTDEECYYQFGRKYCRACDDTIRNDPETLKLALFMSRYGDIET